MTKPQTTRAEPSSTKATASEPPRTAGKKEKQPPQTCYVVTEGPAEKEFVGDDVDIPVGAALTVHGAVQLVIQSMEAFRDENMPDLDQNTFDKAIKDATTAILNDITANNKASFVFERCQLYTVLSGTFAP